MTDFGDDIKFGSKEFLENANLNRFVDSTVQASDADLGATINRAFAPKNLTIQPIVFPINRTYPVVDDRFDLSTKLNAIFQPPRA